MKAEKRFLLHTLLWLPVCFLVWYQLRGLLVVPVLLGLRLLAPWLPAVDHIEYQGDHLAAVLSLRADTLPGLQIPAGKTAEILVSLDPLAYGYGLALFAALLLATPDDHRRWWHWLLGLVVLWLVQLWGLSFELLKNLFFGLPPGLSAGPTLSDTLKNLVALGYQFGYLIAPAVVPVGLWMILQRHWLGELTPALAQRLKDR